jgi:hypothetical protein
MKVGDLLVSRTGAQEDDGATPMLLILGIKEHPSDSSRDKVQLQWVPRNGGEALKGEFSRLMVEKRYKIV